MDASSLSSLSIWLTEAGLMGTSESALLHGFAERAVAAGVPLARATALIDTLHPIHEGRVFRWRAAVHRGARPGMTIWERIGRVSNSVTLARQREDPSADVETGERRLRRVGPQRSIRNGCGRRRGEWVPGARPGMTEFEEKA